MLNSWASMPTNDAGVIPFIDRRDGFLECNEVSTSPPPACWPSRCGRIRSRTTWRTPPRRATRPIARCSGRSTRCSSIADIRTDLSQAPLRQTGQPLDVALNGDGFIAVATADGVRYTRNGQLSVDSAGRLLTGGGLTVLGTDGRPIVVGATDDIQIAGDGSVTAGNRRVGTIAVVGLDGATKAGEGLFVGTPIAKPADTTLEQGFVEGSGVDPTRSMVDMIVSLRAFEASQRVIHAIGETLGKAVNQVGSPTGQ
jgi:flagellar basal-body rod protein FlgF